MFLIDVSSVEFIWEACQSSPSDVEWVSFFFPLPLLLAPLYPLPQVLGMRSEIIPFRGDLAAGPWQLLPGFPAFWTASPLKLPPKEPMVGS